MSTTSSNSNDTIFEARWTLNALNLTGDAIRCRHPHRCVQAVGTFDSGTVHIEGSLDGQTWFALTKDGTNAITFSANGMAAIHESTSYVRVRIAEASNPNVVVTLTALRTH